MHSLNQALEKIHLTPENGLVFCNQPNQAKYIGELYHIQEKAIKLNATAVLFRRKYNENNKAEIIDSKPVLYIFEKDDNFSQDEHVELHAKIWSAGDIDVYFIVSKTKIDIFNARKPAQVKADLKLDLENLCLLSEALEQFDDQRFSAIVFGKGTFWEQEDFIDDSKDQSFFNNQLREENAPYHKLLEHLIAVREHLRKNQQGLPIVTVDKLLIICILIKFLEEIKDDQGKHTLRNIYKKHNVNNFAKVLIKGKCISVLNELSREFNGSIFNNFDYSEKQNIEKADLRLVADFLEARLDIATRQYFLWQQYSFSHLPVELISSIYENFLPKEKGIVYTPPFLVNFLIDEAMPLNKADMYFSQNKFQVLDPSCGSGVFLVAAYKRMLQWWSVNRYRDSQKIEFPDKIICQEILEKNIFGIDLHAAATLITVFSLTIALLDKLEPKEIWNNLKLNSLQDSIRTQDFFEWAANVKTKNIKYDLVIGNPPFNDEKGKSAHKIKPELALKIGFHHKKVALNNFALQFFEGGMALGKKVMLILPSNVVLYNRNSQKYREQIFRDFTIEKIYDFTHLRRELFGSIDTPVCAVLSNPTASNGEAIEHTIIKRTISTEKKIYFEIDHYDRHFVRHDWAVDAKKQFIWKTNLLGGGRLFHLIYRLSLLETLKQFIERKKNNEWIYNSGYKVGGKSKKKLAAFIHKGDKIESIDEDGNYSVSLEGEKNELLEFFPDEKLYKPPFLVFDQILGEHNIPICFVQKYEKKEYLYFNRDFVGIHVPMENIDELKKIYDFVKIKFRNLYRFYALIQSGSCMVLTETEINKRDIDSLPFPEDEKYLHLSEAEKILQDDVLEYYIHSGKSISKRGEGRKFYEKVTQKQLEKFGNTFCDVINPMHAENEMSWQIGDVYQTPEKLFIIYQFIFGAKKQASQFELKEISIDDLDRKLNNVLFNDKENKAAIFTRITRIYGSQDDFDYLILIKPTAMRYWLHSIAIRDADETIWDYYEAGY